MGKNSHSGRGIIFPEVNIMDQVKTGKFIAMLRRQSGLTQEALGEKIGVTNKTISRWETGKYMPDIEMLQILAKEFDVSINELLAGKKVPDEEFRRLTNENIIAGSKESVFSFEERKAFFKKKWRKNHISLLVTMVIILIAAFVLPFVCHKPWFLGLAPLIAFVEYGYQNNKMMIYVEKCLYD